MLPAKQDTRNRCGLSTKRKRSMGAITNWLKHSVCPGPALGRARQPGHRPQRLAAESLGALCARCGRVRRSWHYVRFARAANAARSKGATVHAPTRQGRARGRLTAAPLSAATWFHERALADHAAEGPTPVGRPGVHAEGRGRVHRQASRGLRRDEYGRGEL